jgi:hypothetical protein
MSEIRVIVTKANEVKVKVDGQEIRLPAPGNDKVISVNNVIWAVREEQSVEEQEI